MNTDNLVYDLAFTPFNKYYTANEFNSAFATDPNNKVQFSILHINIRSLQKNFDTFEEFLSSIKEFPFSLIALTETWLHNNSPSLFTINNYKLCHIDRQNGKGGGVAFYIHNDLQYKIRHDIHLEGIENLFLEILDHKHKNKIVGVVYRPPSNTLDTFLDNFESGLEQIARENKDIYIAGDFNIDISPPLTALGQRFINLLSSLSLSPLINKPTRITHLTRTIIDNIICNVLDEKHVGIIYYDISDHLPIFTICQENTHPRKPTTKHTTIRRKETKQNIESLMLDLSRETWDDIYFERDVNKSYDKFIKKLLSYYDKNVPLTRINLDKRKNKKPWITPGLIKSIYTRNRLYKISLKSPSIENINKYKVYRNKLTSSIRLARKSYFSNKIENNKDNNQTLWQTVNEILGKKKETVHNIQFENEGRKIHQDDISNVFNKFFTNIGPKLASNIVTNNPNDFSKYLNNDMQHSLFFNPTSIHEILEIVRSLKSTKSTGHDELSVSLLKQIVHFIASPLSHIFNLSLSQGIFPDLLKLAKVIPVYIKKMTHRKLLIIDQFLYYLAFLKF